MATRERRVALDCDGILAFFLESAVRLTNDLLGRNFKVEDVTAFDFTKSLGLSSADATKVKDAISAKEGFAAGLSVLPGALDGVRRLREIAAVHVVTSPWNTNKHWYSEREAWLRRHFGIDDKHVHHSASKYMWAADMFVDDRAKHVKAWAQEWPNKIAVLWRTPHNGSEQLPAGARETSSWDDLVSWIKPNTTLELWNQGVCGAY